METLNKLKKLKSLFFALALFVVPFVNAQTNVYDDIISSSANHTYLKAAIDEAGLVDKSDEAVPPISVQLVPLISDEVVPLFDGI